MEEIEDWDWNPINLEKARWLERLFEEEEICRAVFGLQGEKAPVACLGTIQSSYFSQKKSCC